MIEYDICKNKIMILTLIIIYLKKQDNKSSEIVRLFLLISLLLDRRIKEGYKNRTNLEYFLKKEEKQFSKYRIYYNIQKNLINYQQNIYDAIDMGNKMRIINVRYDSINNNIMVELLHDKITNLPKTRLPNTVDAIKNIDKIIKFTANVSTDYLISLMGLEV